ncbi:hypothetical protein BTM22_25730 [Vibrio parahaemolyticus]|uniref:Uncharacterized protein n=2 Tax=Vibrionaceae TaxID=641 RepID=A0A1Z2SAY4_VIBGA|nr:hypothetical protein BSQ33_00460 [Vibrio gazogenes]OUJ45693.1 hypothetical protein BTM22_25730 [Vibrio parahaemolyticus]
MDDSKKLDAEWLALNAFRGMTKIASHGDMEKSTYDAALDLGGELYPELLGPEVSLLKSERESDITKEYRQKARLKSIKAHSPVTPLELVIADIEEHEELLEIAKQEKDKKQKVDQLQRRLAMLNKARKELEPKSHSENQLIFRDAYNVQRELKSLESGQGYRDFELPNSNILRVRVLHPDNPEHITGSDIIYERHAPLEDKVSIVAVQYKIWEDKKIYLSDQRMLDQIEKMKNFMCSKKVCESKSNANNYRFPCCSAFLRPTDKLQRADQKFLSKGEHIPICKIEECSSTGPRGGKLLEYKNMRDVALSNEAFEFLFNKGKIGSDYMTQDELHELYSGALMEASTERVVIYAQEFQA